MCRATLFRITVSLENLQGTTFEREYLRLVGGTGGIAPVGNIFSFYSWAIGPCMPQFRELTPPAPQYLTLQAYYNPPTYFLELVPHSGQLQAQRVSAKEPENNHSIFVSLEDLPVYPGVPRLSASECYILPDPNNSSSSIPVADRISSDTPRRVQTGEGKIMFFKQVYEIGSFRRELDILNRIADLGLKIGVPKLLGIVVSHEASTAMGMLLDWIPGRDLFRVDRAEFAQAAKLDKWKNQLAEIVTVLHKHDIVWGDVHPGNVIIDSNSDAWAVDFGGGINPDFIDWKNEETKNGDWQGFQNTFKWFTEEAD
ncbi:MAG: hypothetical protein M1840_008141 [Geoglossum simile]|nr:MAG: hypothetical protein M1840_008141 [Geoglossum simile]